MWQASIICCIDFIMVDLALFLIISAVPKCIAKDVAIINAILLIYIMSMVMVTTPCSASNPLGRLLMGVLNSYDF